MKGSNKIRIPHITPKYEEFLSVPEHLDIEDFKVWIEQQPNLIFKRDHKTELTLLFKAILNNNYPIAEFLLNHSADPNALNSYGESIIHHAVEKGKHKLINLLLEKGANPNVQQHFGETPMHIAASKGDYKVMKLLLLYKADPMLLTDHGHSALDYARERGHQKCVEVLSPLMLKKKSIQRKESYEGNVDRILSTKNSEGHLNRLKNQVDMNPQLTTLLSNFSSKNSKNNPTEGRNIQQSAYVKRGDNNKDVGLNLNQNISTVSSTNNLSRNTHDKNNFSQNIIHTQFLRKFEEDFTEDEFNSKSNIMNHLLQDKQEHSDENEGDQENSGENQSKKSNLQDSLSNHANILEDKLNKNIQDLMCKIESCEKEDTAENYQATARQFRNVHNHNDDAIHSRNKYKDTSDRAISPDNSYKSNNSKLQASNIPVYLNYENLVNSHKSRKKLLSNEKIVGLHKDESNSCAIKESSSNISIPANEENRKIQGQATLSVDNTYDNVNERITNSVNKPGPFSLMNGFTLIHMGTIGNSSIGDDIFNQRDSIQQGGNQTYSNDYDNYNSYMKYSDIFHDKGKVLAFFMSAKNDIIEIQRDAMKNPCIYPMRSSNVKENFKQTQKKIDGLLNINLDQINACPKEVEMGEEEANYTEEVSEARGESCQLSRTDDIHSYENPKKNNKQPQANEMKYNLNPKNGQISIESQNINEINEISVTIFPGNFEKIQQKENDKDKDVRDFLKSIGLEVYSRLLVEHGFDDMKLVIEQMKTGVGISDSNLKEAGISLPGDRAKILIKLEEESKILDYPLPQGKVYYKPSTRMKDYLSDHRVQSIHKWLSTLKLEQYTINFVKAGYYSIDLLFLQMLSQNPLTDAILDEEIEIKKIGYRVRILNKLRDDSKAYLFKLKNSGINVDKESKENPLDSCKCPIF